MEKRRKGKKKEKKSASGINQNYLALPHWLTSGLGVS